MLDVRPSVHIIYVGGTVELLAPFLGTLLEQTTWSYRLVLNGCDENERRMLERYRREHPERIELQAISADEVMNHGPVLDQLLAAETSEYFCILDSDILAKGSPDLSELLPKGDQVATCACLPLWHSPLDRVLPSGSHIMAGRFLRTEDGTFLGCTYAAAYRTDALRRTLHEWGLSLRTYEWNELPPAVQQELEIRGLRHRLYDTAKVANILLQTSAGSMVYVDLPDLIHLGAQSGRAAQTPGLRRSFRQFALMNAPWLIGIRWRLSGMGQDERRSVLELARRRGDASRLLASLRDGGASFANAPDWIESEDVFAALEAVLTSRVLVDSS